MQQHLATMTECEGEFGFFFYTALRENVYWNIMERKFKHRVVIRKLFTKKDGFLYYPEAKVLFEINEELRKLNTEINRGMLDMSSKNELAVAS